MEYSAGHRGYSIKKRPEEYPRTLQQQKVTDALSGCGITKGVSKYDLMLKMRDCMPGQFSKENSGNPGKENKEKPITIFVSGNCLPCEEIVELVKQGRMFDDVELVDIESDEGFKRFYKEVLSHTDGGVPSAYKDGAQCQIGFDEEKNLVLECPELTKSKKK